MDEIKDIQRLLREFADLRNWHEYHTPKNLAMAIAGEAGELVAEFQWLSQEEAASLIDAGQRRDNVADEIADVAIYLFRLADVLDINLNAAIRAKVARNETRSWHI